MTTSFRRAALSGSLVSGTGMFLRLLIQGLSIVLMARLLTPADFGLVAMAYPVVLLAVAMQEAGLDLALVQRSDVPDPELSTIFWLNVAFALTLVLILLACAPLVASFFGDMRVALLVQASSAVVLIKALSALPRGMLLRRLRFTALAWVDVVSMGVSLVAAVAVAWITRSYWSILLMWLVESLLACLIYWVLGAWKPGRCAPLGRVLDVVRFSGYLSLGSVFDFLERSFDNVLIGRYWGDVGLGLYDRAYKLMLLPLFLVNAPLRRVIVPMLSRSRDDGARYRRIYLSGLRTTLLIVVPSAAVLIAGSHEIVTLLLGPSWAEAAPIFYWLGFALLFQVPNRTMSWLFISQGRPRHLTIAMAVGTAFFCLGFLVGLPWGPVGVALAYAICEAVRSPVMYWWAGRAGPVGFRDLVRTTAPFAIGFPLSLAVAHGLLRFIDLPTLPAIAIAEVASIAVLLAALSISRSGRESLQLAWDNVRLGVEMARGRIGRPSLV